MVKVLFDNNMPPVLARTLNELISIDGHTALPLRDKFPTNISDIEYFTELGKDKDWIVISKDNKNAKRTPERNAIMASGVLAFYLAPSVEKQKIHEQAATIIWHWETILQNRRSLSNGMFLMPIGKGSRFKSM